MISIPLRCTTVQAKRWAQLARESNLDRSTWMRETLDLGTALEVQTQTTVTVKRRKDAP
jgi:hypothetical protein